MRTASTYLRRLALLNRLLGAALIRRSLHGGMLLDCMFGVEVERVLVAAEAARMERCSLVQLSLPRVRLVSA
jgi:hypothetical protein